MRFVAGAKEIDIAATLEHLRDQRPGMVQTKVLSSSPLGKLMDISGGEGGAGRGGRGVCYTPFKSSQSLLCDMSTPLKSVNV